MRVVEEGVTVTMGREGAGGLVWGCVDRRISKRGRAAPGTFEADSDGVQ